MNTYTIDSKVSAKQWRQGRFSYTDREKAITMAQDLDEHGNTVRVSEHTDRGSTVIWTRNMIVI